MRVKSKLFDNFLYKDVTKVGVPMKRNRGLSIPIKSQNVAAFTSTLDNNYAGPSKALDEFTALHGFNCRS